MITVNTIPTIKNKFFIFKDKIFVSYGLLITLDDQELQTAMYHEMGHNIQLKHMTLLLVCFTCFFSVILFAIMLFNLNNIYYAAFLLLFYIVGCWISRLGEYNADRYAFKHTDFECMKRFIIGLNHESKYSNFFYLFRWHPSNRKRLEQLIK